MNRKIKENYISKYKTNASFKKKNLLKSKKKKKQEFDT